MTATKEADLSATLHLVSLAKSKSTEQRSGWVLVFTTPIPNSAVHPGNECEPKLVQHGILTLKRTSMFPDPQAPQTPELVKEAVEAKVEQAAKENKPLVLTGKLRRRDIAARKESPAYSRWTFTLANRPSKEALAVLIDMADANGDEVESECQAEFTVKAETKEDEPRGPELFGDADKMSEEDKKILAGADAEFDQGPEANRLAKDPETGEYIPPSGELKKGEFEAEAKKKGRKRKVEAA